MTERRDVTRDHLRTLFRLKVKPEQDGQVAPNAITLAQAAYEPGGYVWGLWDGDAPVGLMAMIHPLESPDTSEDLRDAAYVWRLMIDAAHQGAGHGRAALREVALQAQAWGMPRVALSAVETELGAIPFYERFGFVRTGRIVHGEVEFVVQTESLLAASSS
ncbi:MAG: GNAT family N-acetyltransferase [Pseudomonadota bacterium]